MNLDWEIIEIIEILKGNWQLIALEAYDEKGNYYTASCETYISGLEIINNNIVDIENHGKV